MVYKVNQSGLHRFVPFYSVQANEMPNEQNFGKKNLKTTNPGCVRRATRFFPPFNFLSLGSTTNQFFL